jgi:DNA-binding response OmpR family regulator
MSGSILLVEEDVLVRHPLAEYLRECGYKVAEAVDADEARQLLVKGSGGIEIVVVHALSETDRGFTLASWIRSIYPEIQVIIAGTLAKATEKAGALCEEGPALTKPYDHKLILAHIRRMQAARIRSKGE